MAKFNKGNKKGRGGARANSGRKPDAVLKAAKAMFEEHGPASITFLAQVRDGKVKGAEAGDRVRAAVFLAEGWAGKAKQAVEHSGEMSYKLYGAGTPLEAI